MKPEPDPHEAAMHRVEAYLDQILAPLMPRLSPFHRDELRRELREHLWARIAAYRELGMAEDDAVTEALRQFGGAQDFLRQWRREWAQTTPQAMLRDIWQAMRCALLFSLPALLMTDRVAPLGSDGWESAGLLFWSGSPVSSGWSSSALAFVLIPLALGVAVGRLAPQRSGVGVLAALAAEMLLSAGVSLSPVATSSGGLAAGLLTQVFICTISWLPLACTAAALTGGWVRRSQARRLTLRDVYEAGRAALRPSLVGVAAAFLLFIVLHVSCLSLRGSVADVVLRSYGGTLDLAWIWFAFLLLPTWVGVRQGRRTPRRAGVGMLAALTAEIAAASLLYGVATRTLPGGVWASLVGSYVQGDIGLLFPIMAVWVPVAGGAAAISGWWTRRSGTRRLA